MTYVTNNCIRDLLDKYIAAGGDVIQVDEGCLGYGTIILCNNGLNLKEFVIQEVYLNEWSSTHKLKTYTKGLPKKYLKMLDMVLD